MSITLRIMMKLINILTLALFISISALGQSIPEGLVNAMKTGNAKNLSEFFHQSLEMTILEKDYNSSKNQATRIMEDFFRDHKPIDFTIFTNCIRAASFLTLNMCHIVVLFFS